MCVRDSWQKRALWLLGTFSPGTQPWLQHCLLGQELCSCLCPAVQREQFLRSGQALLCSPRAQSWLPSVKQSDFGLYMSQSLSDLLVPPLVLIHLCARLGGQGLGGASTVRLEPLASLHRVSQQALRTFGLNLTEKPFSCALFGIFMSHLTALYWCL